MGPVVRCFLLPARSWRLLLLRVTRCLPPLSAHSGAVLALHTYTGLCERRLNKCGVISPRYDIVHGQIEDWVARLLPSRLVRSASSDFFTPADLSELAPCGGCSSRQRARASIIPLAALAYLYQG